MGLLLLGTSTVPFLTYLASRMLQGEALRAHYTTLLLIIIALILPLAVRPFLRRLEPLIDAGARHQADRAAG